MWHVLKIRKSFLLRTILTVGVYWEGSSKNKLKIHNFLNSILLLDKYNINETLIFDLRFSNWRKKKTLPWWSDICVVWKHLFVFGEVDVNIKRVCGEREFCGAQLQWGRIIWLHVNRNCSRGRGRRRNNCPQVVFVWTTDHMTTSESQRSALHLCTCGYRSWQITLVVTSVRGQSRSGVVQVKGQG